MVKKGLLFLLLTLFSLGACSHQDSLITSKDATSKAEVKEEKKIEESYSLLAEQKNKDLEQSPIILSTYAEEVGLTLRQPLSEQFAANGSVLIEGTIEQTNIQSAYVWVVVQSSKSDPGGNQMDYFLPIKDGAFKETIHLFNGEGTYNVSIKLPSMEQENYYYDSAYFKVENVNPQIQRDIALNRYGHEAGLSINPKKGHVKEEGFYLLEGSLQHPVDDTLMIRLTKDSDTWNTVIPVKDGIFSYKVPLYFGEGIHSLEVMVPDLQRDNYFQTATTILIDNLSTEKRKPIEYSTVYLERGLNLHQPFYSGEKAEYTYSIKGKIDKTAELAEDTTHLYVETKKGEDRALEVIPVRNYQFDSSFHLRFGPGVYEVTVHVPIITYKKSNYYEYHEVAKFEVESIGTVDKRNLLPARGIQTTASEIIELSNSLTNNLPNDVEKAKSIYEYVAKNVSYDVNKLNTNDFQWDDSALKTLGLKKGVCQDYAYLTIALLRASNIEARMIEGYAPDRHAWVEVLLNGNWITMDPTWGAGYVQNNQFIASYSEKYFDPDRKEFEKTHTKIGIIY